MLLVSLKIIALLVIRTNPSYSETTDEKPQPTPFQDWDYLVYSQRWPITSCAEWQERAKQNSCNLPKDRTTWTVHGIWPTKIGEMGPFFCDSALHFDMSQLEPILADLQQQWTNVENNTKPDSFWKHEWDKHGTCASTLPQLDSVTNFFKRGLLWNLQYDVGDLLNENRIVPNPDAGYTVENVNDAIKGTTGKNPDVQCVVDGRTKQSLLSEIRICFDKSLSVIDCNVSNAAVGGLLTNCNQEKPVMYLGGVPNATRTEAEGADDDFRGDDYDVSFALECQEYIRNREVLLNLYYLIRFMIWFTI